jgi:NAD(P)H dehydrogenase (quinone)
MRISLLLISLVFGFSGFLHGQENPLILVTYYSQSGNTKALAEAIAQGANSTEGIQVKLLPIEEVQPEHLINASAIILGSPVYNANIAPAVQEFINSWPFEGRPLKNKIGAAFSTGGGISIGEELVMLNILHSMLIHGMIVIGGEEVEASFGASAVTREGPFDQRKIHEIFLGKGFGLGKRVAELALKL